MNFYIYNLYTMSKRIHCMNQQLALLTADYQAVCQKCQSEIIRSLIVYKSIL